MSIPKKVHIIEVGPRDGLQNETQTLVAFPTNQIAGRTGIDPALKI